MPFTYIPPDPLLRRFSVRDSMLVLPSQILSGTSLSDGLSFGLLRMGALLIPSSWTTANLTFQSSMDMNTWGNVYDGAGNEYTVNITTPGQYLILDPSAFSMMAFLKIRSGTSSAPVNQSGTRTILVSLS